MPLMSIPRIAPATSAASSRGARELHAAGLAATADEDLGLDDDLAGPGGEEAAAAARASSTRVGDLPGRDRQALGDEQRLGVGFLDLHGRAGTPSRWAGRGSMVPRRACGEAPRRTSTGRWNEVPPLASPYSRASQVGPPSPRGDMQRDLVERARKGDHDAFAELAGAAISRLDGAAWLILRDPEQAKDAVPERARPSLA